MGAAKSRDASLTQQILDCCQALEDTIRPLVQGVTDVFNNIDDRQAQRRLSDVLDKICELSDLLDKLLPRDSDITSNGKGLDSALSSLIQGLADEGRKQQM